MKEFLRVLRLTAFGAYVLIVAGLLVLVPGHIIIGGIAVFAGWEPPLPSFFLWSAGVGTCSWCAWAGCYMVGCLTTKYMKDAVDRREED